MAVGVGRLRLFWWMVARAVLASVLLAALGVATVGVLSVIGLPLVLIGLVALRPLAGPQPALPLPTRFSRRADLPDHNCAGLWC